MLNTILAAVGMNHTGSSMNSGIESLVVPAIIIIVISAVIAAAYVKSLSNNMNNIKNQTSAYNYVVDGSFKLVRKNDRFLFSNVVRHQRQQNHGGAGGMHGGMHGGHGGPRGGGGGRR